MKPSILAVTLLLCLVGIGMMARFGMSLPTGADIITAETSGVPNATPDNRSDARGTITTIVLDATQQDQNWKAYVGNVTGRLSLDDAAGNTIYDWALSTVNKSGKVYISRALSPSFTNVSCADEANVSAEQTFHNMTSTQTDNINKTFNYTSHDAFYVGTQSFNANTCKSTATYRNDSRTYNLMDGSQKFQEVVLQDNTDNVIFMTIFAGNNSGYDNRQYDFQMIVPESAIKSTPTAYYFFTELTG
jgi:hypothetical protein